MALAILILIDYRQRKTFTMTSAQDTSVQKLEAKMLWLMLGRPTRKHVNNMCGAIPAVYAEANTSHDSFLLGSKFGFSAALLKKDKYIALLLSMFV